VPDERKRITLSTAQVALMNDVLRGSPSSVIDAAERIARGEAVPDEHAEMVVDALTNAMLHDEGFDGHGLTGRGKQVDDLIGIVQQMSEHFYD
jgi:hypothetical protein